MKKPKIVICCRCLKELVRRKAVRYFEKGSFFAGIRRGRFGLITSGGIEAIQITYCPRCKKKLKVQ